MKRGVLKDELAASLIQADRAYVYGSGLGWDPRAALAPSGAKASCQDDLEALVREIIRDARPGDHILVMSNGGFGGIHEKLLQRLGERAK
jgi:UDP-N-acetylmuramate: L-alanyl-gamma-D-glutamyl-meso-diaminopimelate ligase